MRTRSQGEAQHDIDLELEATCRRNRLNRATMAENEGDPPNEMDQIRLQLQNMGALLLRYEEDRQRDRRQRERPIHDLFTHNDPYVAGFGIGVHANSFELKPALIHMAQQIAFGGRSVEDPNTFMRTFLEVCDTIKMNGVSDDAIKLRLFPFALKDEAKDWFHSLDRASITGWNDLRSKFLYKYFPPSKTIRMQGEITQFLQHGEETLYEAWERFKGLLRKCPQHGFSEEQQICHFYRGTTPHIKSLIDATAGGSILNKGSGEAYKILEEMAMNSYQWSTEPRVVRKVAQVESNEVLELKEQVALLSNQLAVAMNRKNDIHMPIDSRIEEPLDVYYMNQFGNRAQAPYQNQGRYQYGQGMRPQGDGNAYHPNNRNHPNFSYSNPNNALVPPPGFAVENGMVKEPSIKRTTEELLQEILKGQNATAARVSKLEDEVVSLGKFMKMMEVTMGQIASSSNSTIKPGQFPSDTEVNPNAHCKAITLRSGNTYQGPRKPSEEVQELDKGNKRVDDEKAKIDVERALRSPRIEPSPIPKESSKAPFPQRLVKKKEDEDFEKFLDVFKQVKVNMPLIESLKSNPKYFKFLKDAISGKRKIKEHEMICLTGECSAVLQRELPEKLGDPGSFTIPCEIGGGKELNALCDLGSSINLIPFSLFRKLQLGTIRCAKMKLQMADKTLVSPMGVVENVLVKVQEFIFPVDFVVLDMPTDDDVPIILGRPFLATCHAEIKMATGELSLGVGEERTTFCIFKHKPPVIWKKEGRVDNPRDESLHVKRLEVFDFFLPFEGPRIDNLYMIHKIEEDKWDDFFFLDE